MGAITTIRKMSPYLMAVIATLFIAFMIIQDSSCSSIRSQQQSNANAVVGEINGEKIYARDFELRVREVLEQQKQQNPNMEVDDENIREQVWDALVDETLRRQQAEKMGISVTKQEILDVLLNNPPDFLTQNFKDSTGRFRRQEYLDLMTNPESLGDLYTRSGASQEQADKAVATFKQQILQIEDFLRTSKLEEALRSAVDAAASIPSLARAEVQYKQEMGTADVQYVAVSIDQVPEASVKVSDEEIAAYYEKNKQYYESKPQRKIKYVAFQMQPSKKDTQLVAQRSMKLQQMLQTMPTPQQRDSAFTVEMAAYNGTTVPFTSLSEIDPQIATALTSMQVKDVFGTLTTPQGIVYVRLDDRRDGVNPLTKAAHILVQFGANKDSSKAEAEKIMARAKKGEDFTALAMQFSKDPGSAQSGGDLGWFGKGKMVKEFEDAALTAPVGSVVGPIETQFGWHIIKVTDRQSVELAYSQIALQVKASNATRQAIRAEAEMLRKKVEEGQNIDSVAKQMKLMAQETPFFQRTTPILGSRPITTFAFTGAKGDVLRTDMKNYGLVVVQITDAREAGIAPLEDVKDRITLTLKNKKRMDQLKSRIDAIHSACTSAGSLAAASTLPQPAEVFVATGLHNNGGLQSFTGEYEATNAAFTQPIGQIGKPVRGDRAWFVLQVTARVDANMADFQKDPKKWLAEQTRRTRGNGYFTWFQKVRENATIEDLRSKRD